MSDKQLPAVKLAVGMAMIGTVGAFAVESGLSPVSVVFWRCVFGTLFLGLWCIIRGYLPDRSLSLKRLTYASLAGVCMVLSWIAFFCRIHTYLNSHNNYCLSHTTFLCCTD